MSEQSIKEVVKERYGQAALRVIKGAALAAVRRRRWKAVRTRSLRTSTTAVKPARFRKKP